MTTTNLQYMKKEQLQSVVQVLLYLNLGTSYSSAMDITDWVRDIAIDVAEGMLDTSGNTSGQLIDKIEIILDNTRGDFDATGRFFNAGIVNNSKIKVIACYTEATVSGGVIYPGTNLAPYTFNGVLKADSSSYDYSGPERIFRAGILQAANIMASEIINQGYLTQNSSLAEIALQIMSQPTITNVLGVSAGNINLGSDVAGCVDNISELIGQKVLDAINAIGILSNSVWYIDANNDFIMEPIKNSGASSWDIGIEDIVTPGIGDLGYFPLQFNSVTWDDGQRDIINIQMTYDLRQRYGYDCFEKKLDFKWIMTDANRQTLLLNYLYQYWFQHRMITFTCKSNPELRYNQLITLDVPRQYALKSNSFIWGKSSWGDGSFWTPGITGIKISPGILWRVVSINRKLNLSPDMTIVAVQAGIGQDSAL
jgi:hypothetical protein